MHRKKFSTNHMHPLLDRCLERLLIQCCVLGSDSSSILPSSCQYRIALRQLGCVSVPNSHFSQLPSTLHERGGSRLSLVCIPLESLAQDSVGQILVLDVVEVKTG